MPKPDLQCSRSPRCSDAPSSVLPEQLPARRRLLHVARACGVAVWALGTTGFVTYLMALHAMPLPAVASTPAVSTAKNITASTSDTTHHAWRAVHVLAAGCPCSGSIADYLLQRGPTAGVEETAYIASEELAGPDATKLAAKLQARGYAVYCVTPDELQSTLGVRGGPWFLCIDPQGSTLYSGGYAPQRPRAGVAFEDVSILRQLQAGETVVAEPAFGCALDPALQRQMDPLRVKYTPASLASPFTTDSRSSL